jgi:hypothetical protein
MQPQDQNYQSNDQANPTSPIDEQAINAEQLEPAPSQEDQLAQPPQTPFDDSLQKQDVGDIPEVPDLSAVPSSDDQAEMEHLAEPPSQPIDDTSVSEQLTAPAMDEADDQNDQFIPTSEASTYNQPTENNESESSMTSSAPVEESVLESSVEVPTPTEISQPEELSAPTEPELDLPNLTNNSAHSTDNFDVQLPPEPEQPTNPEQNTQATIPETSEPQDNTNVGNSPVEDTVPEQTLGVEATTENNTPPAPENLDTPATEVQAKEPVEAQPPTERVSLTDHGSFEPQEPQAVANTTVATPEEKENIYTEICSEIIKEQEQIIGTLAVEQANYVEGLSVDPVSYHCTVTGDGSKVIDDLIEQYRDFFGHAAVEVCKEAASRFLARLPAEELPTSLR